MLKNFTVLSVVAALLSYSIASAQSVGVNTDKPGSTLDINGSLAAKYTAVTSATYAMTSSDFHISYNGTANATFTLPAAISGAGNFKGRMYHIKNNTAFTITVNPATSETINGNASITVAPNQSLQLISTGLTGAASTWEVSGNNSLMTASNGLTAVANDVRLGGTLLQNTAIDYGDKALYFRSNVDGYGLTAISNINAGTNAAALLQFTNNAGSSLDMFLNSSTKTTDGGANAATISNLGGPITLKGSNSIAQFRVGFNGLQYYYNAGNMLSVDGNGDISMNRPEVSGVGGNKVSATQGHLDLSGYNTLNGSSTQIYLGAQGFKYSYSGATVTTIDGSGNIYSASYNIASDMRLKTQIKEIGYGLNTIMALQPKQYEISNNIEIKDGKPVVDPGLKTQHKVGFLAQDLYKMIPEAVHKPKDDSKEIWTVDYTVLVPALTKAIQEQQAEIEQQKTKIKKLEFEMQAIKKKLGL
ncbi:tail fiber domain-containing protein [Chryseobacterium tongliaoense]|uniref:tail fiber domain-containing protein n=1 Tax=Chryseobacterium tongliaoense TaxID=3240933 RepID=UPI003517A4BA